MDIHQNLTLFTQSFFCTHLKYFYVKHNYLAISLFLNFPYMQINAKIYSVTFEGVLINFTEMLIKIKYAVFKNIHQNKLINLILLS